MPFEHGGETGVDRLRERHALPCRRRPADADERCDGGRRARRERADDVLRAAELRPLRRRQRALADARTDRKVLLGELLPAPTARRHEPAARREQRVARVVGPDLRARPVRGLQVRARVTEVAHGAEMQHRWGPVLPHPLPQLARGLEHRGGVVSLDPLDGELRPAVERLLDPRLGRRHADPEAVVLADEEQREWLAVVREEGRRVERSLCRRVVQRRVAERAHDDRVVCPRRLDSEAAGTLDRERHAHCARKVRGDRRGLRNDRELAVAEDLVPAACERLLGCGGHPEQDVLDPVASRLRRSREVEATRAVVKEGRVARAQPQRDVGVGLVPGGADRVEAAALLLQPSRGVVDRTARGLRTPRDLGILRCRRSAVLGGQGAKRRDEVLLERVEVARHGRGRYRVKRRREPPLGGCSTPSPAPMVRTEAGHVRDRRAGRSAGGPTGFSSPRLAAPLPSG